jgi:restriction system protein
MDEATTCDELDSRLHEIGPIQFEHLCKLVIEAVEDPDGIETTRRSSDGGIDIRGYVGEECYTGEFGVQVKQYEETVVSEGAVRALAGSLRGHG